MKKKLDALVNKAIEEKVFPGCNIAIVKMDEEGKINKSFYSYGNKALFPNIEENDIDTIYDMASCSKVVSTTTCVMLLLQRGQIRLYDYIKKYLPDYKYDDVTIWDLLTHTAGLPEGLVGCHHMNREEIINGVLNLEKKFEKNTKIVYSDCGFVLLGMIVESVSGKTVDEFAKENIFDVLDMIDSGYNPKDELRCAPTEDRGEYIDRGYVHDEVAHIFEGVCGHAGLFSTVEDISHFILMVLNDGVYKGKKILSKQTIDLMFTPQVEEKNGVSLTNEKRSVGWIVKGCYPNSGDLASPNTIMHTGFTGTNIVIDRDNKAGFSLLTNRVHPTRANNKVIAFRSRLGNYIFSHLEEL